MFSLWESNPEKSTQTETFIPTYDETEIPRQNSPQNIYREISSEQTEISHLTLKTIHFMIKDLEERVYELFLKLEHYVCLQAKIQDLGDGFYIMKESIIREASKRAKLQSEIAFRFAEIDARILRLEEKLSLKKTIIPTS